MLGSGDSRQARPRRPRSSTIVRREDRVTRARANSSPGPYIAELVLDRPSPPPATPEYPLNIPAIAAIGSLPIHPSVTFLAGENGSGKSTILEAVAYSLPPQPRGAEAATSPPGSPTPRPSPPAGRAPRRRPADLYFLRAELLQPRLRDRTPRQGDRRRPSPSTTAAARSTSSRTAESFFSLFDHRFFGPGLYLLDEQAALSPPCAQIAVLGIIDRLVRAGSQFLVATHSPILLAFPSAAIYLLDESGIRPVPYRESPPFRVTRAFLENPELSLRELLRPDQTA